MSIREKFNYSIYNLASTVKGRFLRSLPSAFVPKKLNLSTSLEIGITTYVDRYDSFFKPLYCSIRQLFPDINIYIAVNGFHDQLVQNDYLTRLHSELCMPNFGNSKFILHDQPVGLTRLWNELVCLGTSPTILILNDDLRIYSWFRHWLEKKTWGSSITLINGTWSHFFLCKELLDKIGWFDENFRGIGFEDMDYTARCLYHGVKIDNQRCQFITHHDHQPMRTSFDDQSQTLWGPKYSSINHDTFFSKWQTCDYDSGIYIKQLDSFVIPRSHLGVEWRGDALNLKFNKGVCFPDRG
jgi:hypothetical protein